MDKNLVKSLAIGAATVVAAFGSWALGKSSSSSAGSSAQIVQPARARLPPGGQAPPGFGSAVTGAAASRAEKAALAKYPGRVEVVVQLPDGSYVVHVITSSGEVHVAVSKDLRVTGTERGGPPAGAPPSGAVTPVFSASSQTSRSWR